MEERIKTLCGLYLGWNGTEHRIVVEKLGKGCSNEVLTATLQDTNSKVLDKVLVRMYGSNINGRLLQDVYINCHLATLGRIPRIRGLFEGGRFEEFLPCTNISREDFSGQYRDLMKLIVEVHKLEMPIAKEPCLESLLRGMLVGVKCEEERWRGEVEWYVASLERIGRELSITFCHNDFNMNNLLIPTNTNSVSSSTTSSSPLSACSTASSSSPLSACSTASSSSPSSSTIPILIDYEYSGYNYSLYDLANYCTEMQYDWSHDQPPYFKFSSDWFPDNSKMLDMISCYKTLAAGDKTEEDCNSRKEEEKDPHLALTQLKFLVLGSELLWTLWALSYDGFSLEMEDYLRAKSESYLTKKREYWDEIEKLLNSYHCDTS